VCIKKYNKMKENKWDTFEGKFIKQDRMQKEFDDTKFKYEELHTIQCPKGNV
jgi:hypothetical protein